MIKNAELKKKSEEIGINGLNSISNLEADIMKIVWERKKVTVREVHEYMLRIEIESKKEGFIPYTTVMSTMTTLAEKGLLKQDKSSKTYIYSAAVNNRELSKSIIKSVAEKLLEESSKKIISSFFEDTPDISAESVEKLLKEIK